MPLQLLAVCWFVPYRTPRQPHQQWFCPKHQNLCNISVLSCRVTLPNVPLACGASLLKLPATRGRLFLEQRVRDVLPLLLNTLFTDAMHPPHSHACEDPRDTWNQAILLGQWSWDKEEPPGALRSVRGKLGADTLTQSADKLLGITMRAVKQLTPRVHCCCGISAPPVATSALRLKGVSTDHRNAASQAKLPTTSQTGKARLRLHRCCNFVCLRGKCTKSPRRAPDCSRWSSQTGCGFIPYSCGTLCAFSKSLWAWDTKLQGHIPEHIDYCLHFHTVVHPRFFKHWELNQLKNNTF